jgi:hypothetical protein
MNHYSISNFGAHWFTICSMFTLLVNLWFQCSCLFMCAMLTLEFWFLNQWISLLKPYWTLNLCVWCWILHHWSFDDHHLFLHLFVIHHSTLAQQFVAYSFWNCFNFNIFSKLIVHFQIWVLFLHSRLKNQWSKFLVCVLCRAKLLVQIACLLLQALMTPNSWFELFIWCYKDTSHQTTRLDLLYEIVNTHNTKLLV